MKKIFALAFTTALFISCDKGGYTISGDVKGFDDGTVVYINRIEEATGFVKIDSTEIQAGTFEFKGESPELDLYFIELGTTQEFAFPFVWENGSIKFTFDKEKPEEVKVTGTKNNDLMTSYNEEAYKIQQEIKNFQDQNQQKFAEAQANEDQETMGSIIDGINTLQDKYLEQNKTFIGANKDSYISLLLLTQLSTTDALTSEEIKGYFNNFDTSLKETKKGKEFAETLKKIEEDEKERQKVAIGQKAPDFSANTPEGTTESLYNNLGKVTIIDFWASWCGPCRRENPNVVALYNKYKDNGLKIIGVSLDKENEKWVQAIADDQLDWLQISNLKFWDDPIAKDYFVESIPATFILDENGTIVAKDLRGAELENKIAELLK
ncbi:MAG TPA: TlpA disulfide reductase family protein [Flavobacterium sp.]|nr:TlpA disulfide reductase family protein [Flavobacterium sp.]